MLSPTEIYRVARAYARSASVRLIVREPSKAARLIAGTVIANEIDTLIIEQCQGKGRVVIQKEYVVVLT